MGAAAAWFEARPWAKLILAFLAGLPAMVLALAPFFPQLESYLKASPILTLCLSIGWAVVVTLVAAVALACKPPPSGSVFELLHLLECLKQIVGEKVNRFESFLTRQTMENSLEVFTEITRPDQQLASIVAAVYSYFEGVLSKEDKEQKVKLRVALARMGQRHVEEWESYYPSYQKPRSEITELQRDTSCFSRAKSTGRMVIIESIKKEAGRRANKRRFEVTDLSRKDEDGSIICYPIKLKGTRQMPFVLSVCSSKPGYFRQGQEGVYQSILENFEQRIVLEYCLQEIKRNNEAVRQSTENHENRSSTSAPL
jgi:hypothetical protein